MEGQEINKGPATLKQCAKRPGFVRLACGARWRPRLAAVCASAVFVNTKIINYKHNSTTKPPPPPPPRRRPAAAAVNRRPPSAVSLPSSSAHACARATPTGTLTSAVVVVAAAAAVVAAAAAVSDAGARTRIWRGEWERRKWVARSKC